MPSQRSRRRSPPGAIPAWLADLEVGLGAAITASAAAIAAYFSQTGRALWGILIFALGVWPLVLTMALRSRNERVRRRQAARQLARAVAAMAQNPLKPIAAPAFPEFDELCEALGSLGQQLDSASSPPQQTLRLDQRLTRSGMYEPPATLPDAGFDPTLSGEFGTLDMVNRLDPRTLRWLDSSKAEQDFLGWSLGELRRKSFLEIVHPDDRSLAWEQLRAALIKGEAHGLIYRIRTARGENRAIEMNVGVRYGPDQTITHLRCHVADVTAKLRASRELRRRTKELTHVNQQLRRANRELQDLKDRYSDLYQNAPAMYFSLDERGNILECNNTLLRTLGFDRNELLGRPYMVLLPETRHSEFPKRFAEFLRTGYIEVESRWKKANGELIDVWVTGTAVLGADGKLSHSRSVAQDVTARRALEAELKEKNDRLARTNEELSRKNKELDEFSYVVSHDLQEPLRTLIAFSDFLVKDCGDRLDDTGKEYVRHLVEAARRMRSLIADLLALSRAGRVTAEFARVELEDVLERVRCDLAELIRTKAAEIRVPQPLPAVWGDRGRISQLLGNLISNGLKYNRSNSPWVEVRVEQADPSGWCVLAIRDNGIGIGSEYHTKIFEMFRRLHPREEFEGTGAGLAICQKIVQAHGGRIWVDSQPGQGSTFYLKLPALPADPVSLRTELLNAP
jgi:PAS domain S-box-containing protein